MNDQEQARVNGRRLRQLRQAQGLTQGQLAVKSGVGQSHISHLEAGERPNAKIATVAKIAGALRVPISELLTVPEPNNLPDFHQYVTRKFRDSPEYQRALIAAYEAIRKAEEELEQKESRREAEYQEWLKRREKRERGDGPPSKE